MNNLIVTPEEWPHGLRCMDCDTTLGEGTAYSKRLTAIHDEGYPVVEIVCAPCGLAHPRGVEVVSESEAYEPRTFREEEHELIDACRMGHGTMYDQDDLADVVAGLAIECENRDAHVRALEEALRAMLELDSYRPRDGSVNESWERGILEIARAALTPEEPKP